MEAWFSDIVFILLLRTDIVFQNEVFNKFKH